LGCGLLEKVLKIHSRQKGWAFDLFWHVCKPLPQPSTIYDVTLAHFYRALGRDLRDWPLWGRFVDDFNPKLFRRSAIPREALRNDPVLLKPLFEWISGERERRLFTHTTMGEADLVEGPANVWRRQTRVAAKIARLRNDPSRLQLEKGLDKIFSELARI
jgi:hypothetical protein